MYTKTVFIKNVFHKKEGKVQEKVDMIFSWYGFLQLLNLMILTMTVYLVNLLENDIGCFLKRFSINVKKKCKKT